jgi:hypothetical protein
MQGETSNIHAKSQISTALRYLSDRNICERFLEFTDISFDGTSDGLFKHVQQVISEFECHQNLFGHTYNEASVRVFIC